MSGYVGVEFDYQGEHWKVLNRPNWMNRTYILRGSKSGERVFYDDQVQEMLAGAAAIRQEPANTEATYIGCDINPVYIEMANTRPVEIKLPMFEAALS